MKVGFARVSTKEQELDLQLKQLNDYGCEKIFHGKHSGVSVKNDEKLGVIKSQRFYQNSVKNL